jgi:hypothetical protein
VIGFVELTKAGTMITNATFKPFRRLQLRRAAVLRAVLSDQPSTPRAWKENPCIPIVEITALRKSFGAHEVLKGIDLQVQPARCSPSSARAARARARCFAASTAGELPARRAVGRRPAAAHDDAAGMRALRSRWA